MMLLPAVSRILALLSFNHMYLRTLLLPAPDPLISTTVTVIVNVAIISGIVCPLPPLPSPLQVPSKMAPLPLPSEAGFSASF